MVELGSSCLKLFGNLELFGLEFVGIALGVYKRCWYEEEYAFSVVWIINAGSHAAYLVGQWGLLYGIAIFRVDNSYDGFGIALDI